MGLHKVRKADTHFRQNCSSVDLVRMLLTILERSYLSWNRLSILPQRSIHFPCSHTELRLKIYSHADALTPPRVIPFFLLPLGHPRTLTGQRLVGCLGTLHIYSAFIPTPALLHTCQESRDFLLPKYSRNFEIKRRFEIRYTFYSYTRGANPSLQDRCCQVSLLLLLSRRSTFCLFGRRRAHV